jgi:hypothetical protein
MHRVERLLVRVQHQDLAHTLFLMCSCEPPEALVMVASTTFSGGTSARHWLGPLHLFHRAVLALQAGLAPEGRNWNTCLENGGSVSSLASARAPGLPEQHVAALQAPAFDAGVHDPISRKARGGGWKSFYHGVLVGDCSATIFWMG